MSRTCRFREEFRRRDQFSEIIGDSAEMAAIYEQIDLVAATDATVLLIGETGTGKELIARALHQCSARKDKLLVIVNCAALPAELIESELFGHEKGAFTGATAQRKGRFELADGGTIFLDEVGEIERAAILAVGPSVEVNDPVLQSQPDIPAQTPDSYTLEQVERAHMERILEGCRWKIEGAKGAAAALGLKPSTLRYRMDKLGIIRPPR